MQMKWTFPLCRHCRSNWVSSVPLCVCTASWAGSGKRETCTILLIGTIATCVKRWEELSAFFSTLNFCYFYAATFVEIIERISGISQNPSGNYMLKCCWVYWKCGKANKQRQLEKKYLNCLLLLFNGNCESNLERFWEDLQAIIKN